MQLNLSDHGLQPKLIKQMKGITFMLPYSLQLAQDLQILADFCGPRDISSFTPENIRAFFGGKPADVMVLFGGSIYGALPVFEQAIQDQAAGCFVIVGGYGHTTSALQQQMKDLLGKIYPSEAETFQAALHLHGLAADLLETRSTNCGNNITFLLDLLKKHQIKCERIILMQDASMQKRMEAGMKKQAPQIQVLNYAASRTRFGEDHGNLVIENPPDGMWSAEKYASLLMGEILRLRDDAQGYGPQGKDFIAHVEIPQEVESAWRRIAQCYPGLIRTANPAFSQPDSKL